MSEQIVHGSQNLLRINSGHFSWWTLDLDGYCYFHVDTSVYFRPSATSMGN